MTAKEGYSHLLTTYLCLLHINLFNSHNTANCTLLLIVMEVKGSEVEELAQVRGQNGEGGFQAWDLLLKSCML